MRGSDDDGELGTGHLSGEVRLIFLTHLPDICPPLLKLLGTVSVHLCWKVPQPAPQRGGGLIPLCFEGATGPKE